MDIDTNSLLKIVAGADDTSGRLALIESLETKGYEPPYHRHLGEAELIYVMKGEIAVLLNGIWLYQSSGNSINIPQGSEHTFSILTPSARLLTVYSPAGFEDFFRELDLRPPWARDSVQELELWVGTAARFGCEITGPHPRPISDNGF